MLWFAIYINDLVETVVNIVRKVADYYKYHPNLSKSVIQKLSKFTIKSQIVGKVGQGKAN